MVTPARERAATAAVWLLVLASIVLLPDAFVRWFLPKDVLAAIAVAVASFAVARGRLPRWFAVAAGVAALLALLSVLLSAAPAAQLWGRWPRYEGLITLPVYFGAVWAGARLLGPDAPDAKLRTLARAIGAAAIALGVVSLLEAVGAGPFPSDLARPGSLTGNATDQGILGALFVAVLALPVLRAWTGLAGVGRARSGRGGSGRGGAPRAGADRATGPAERAWLTAGLLLAVTSVILSASRAGLLAAGVVLLVLLLLELVRLGRGFARRTAFGGIAALLLLLGGALAVPFTRDRLLGSSPLSTSSLEARFTFWRDSLAVLGGHPLGVGASGFLNANASASTGVGTLDSPHNWLFQTAMAGGIPLLVLVLGIVVAAAAVGVRAWRLVACGATAAEPGGSTGPSARGGVADAGRAAPGRPSVAHAAAVLARADAARADLLAAALAGLSGFGVALLTHFTAPSTTILAALLVGVLVAQPGAHPGRLGGLLPGRPGSGAGRSVVAGIRTVLLVGWAVWLVVLTGAEVPLAAGVAAAARSEVAAAEESFETAQRLRPWDADLASIAAQSFAAAADAQVRGAAPPTVAWAERSRAVLPDTVATERALAVGQLSSGDAAAAAHTLDALAVVAPRNVAVAVQHAVALYLAGDISGCEIAVRHALTLDPAEPTALRLRGIIFPQ